MCDDTYSKIESLFEFIVINYNNIKLVNESIQKIGTLIDLIPQNDTKEQFGDILNEINTILHATEIIEKNTALKKQYNKIKLLLFSFSIDILNDFQKKLEKTNIDEFNVINYDGINLMLAGSFDFCYYHNVELIFSEVEFICCQNYFKADNFRIATNRELADLNMITNSNIDSSGFAFCMEDKYFGDKSFIIAHGLRQKWGTVFYYNRENLKPGERIADWVKKI
jgi:hypothetical protein